jgi:hypothetical protein
LGDLDVDEDTIKNDLKGTGWEVVDWINLALDRIQWRAVVNTVINLRIPLKADIFLIS